MPPLAAGFTVAIPTYNGAKYIEEAVRSILRQTDVAFDLIVSDDRSSDDTLDRIRRLVGDRARIEINSERLGLAGNWNQCVKHCRTSWINIFHQDDLMKEGHLATHLAAVNPGVGLIATAAEIIDDGGLPVPPDRVDPGGCGQIDTRFAHGEFLKNLAVSNPLRCSAVSLLVEAHQNAGGFDSAYRYVVDWDCWIKLARSWDVAWIASSTVAMRWHEASETHTFKTGTLDLDESFTLLSALYDRDLALGRFKKTAWKRLARAYLNRAYQAARSGQRSLCRRSLRRAIELSPGVIGTIMRDPRLIARLFSGYFSGEA